MKLFVPICGHKEHQFTGLTSTIGNGEEFRGWWGMHQESISVGGCWSKGSSSSSIWGCVCQLQTPEQNGELCFGGEGNPSSDQLSPVSHPSLRSIATCFWLFPSVSTSLEPSSLAVCKWILPSGHLQLAHPLGTEGAWSSCGANLCVWELRHGQLREEQPWKGTNTIK